MRKVQRLDVMDKLLREVEGLKSSQTSVLKKLTQIERDNIALDINILNDNFQTYMKK